MALDFPASPVNGQVYDNFIYDSAKGTWKSLSSGASPNYLVNPTITNAVITATAPTPSTVPLTVNGATSQSANLQEWKNNSGVVLADIDSAGKANFETGANAVNLKASSTVNHGYMAFYTENTTPTTRTGYIGFGSNGTSTMTIANERSAGTISLNSSYVLMPNQPLFSGTDTRALVITNAILTSANCYNQIDYNVGNHFNATTGRFTAPIAGYYEASVHIGDASTNSTGTNIRITKNGAINTGPLSEGYNQTAGGAVNVFVKSYIYCAAGDYIEFQAAALNTLAGVQHKRFLVRLIQ